MSSSLGVRGCLSGLLAPEWKRCKAWAGAAPAGPGGLEQAEAATLGGSLACGPASQGRSCKGGCGTGIGAARRCLAGDSLPTRLLSLRGCCLGCGTCATAATQLAPAGLPVAPPRPSVMGMVPQGPQCGCRRTPLTCGMELPECHKLSGPPLLQALGNDRGMTKSNDNQLAAGHLHRRCGPQSAAERRPALSGPLETPP